MRKILRVLFFILVVYLIVANIQTRARIDQLESNVSNIDGVTFGQVIKDITDIKSDVNGIIDQAVENDYVEIIQTHQTLESALIAVTAICLAIATIVTLFIQLYNGRQVKAYKEVIDNFKTTVLEELDSMNKLKESVLEMNEELEQKLRDEREKYMELSNNFISLDSRLEHKEYSKLLTECCNLICNNKFKEEYDDSIKADIYYRKAIALFNLKEYEKAKIDISLAICLQTSNAKLAKYYRRLGLIKIQCKEYGEARIELEKAREYDDSIIGLDYAHAFLCYRIGTDVELSKAISYCDSELKSNEYNSLAHLLKGNILQKQGNNELALNSYLNAISKCVSSSEANHLKNSYNNAAHMLVSLDRGREALYYSTRALKLSKNGFIELITHIEVLDSLGLRSEMLTMMKKVSRNVHNYVEKMKEEPIFKKYEKDVEILEALDMYSKKNDMIDKVV